MNNISEEIIEIDGKEYTLWINRIGIVNWEKATKLQETAKELQNKYKDIESGDFSFDNDADPFAGSEVDDDEKRMEDIYSKFYYMALYKNHKLTVSQADELFQKALAEYGIEQLAQLAAQMLEKANTQQGQLKNLKALKSTN